MERDILGRATASQRARMAMRNITASRMYPSSEGFLCGRIGCDAAISLPAPNPIRSECRQIQRLGVVVGHVGNFHASRLDGAYFVAMIDDLAGSGHENVVAVHEEGLAQLVR